MPTASWGPCRRAPSSSSSSATSDPLNHLTADPRERHERLAEALRETSIDVLLVHGESSTTSDLAALVGPVHLGESIVLVAREGEVRLGYTTDMERDEAARVGVDLLRPVDLGGGRRDTARAASRLGALWCNALDSLGVPPGRLALAGSGPAGELVEAAADLAATGWQVVPGNALLRSVRKGKTVWEIDQVRHAAAGVCAAFRAIVAVLCEARIVGGQIRLHGEALTAGSLRSVVDASLAPFGLDQPEGNIVSIGAEAGIPHTQGSSDRALEPSQSIVIDLYPKRHLFADCTRTFCIGPVPEELGRAHRLVEKALAKVSSQARPGGRGADLQAATCDLFEAEDYVTTRSTPGTTSGYVHGLGHGVGFELHELPSFRPTNSPDGTLAAGDVVTLEPGLYDPEAGYGVRLEDLLLVTEDGTENLTPLPYALDPRAW